MAPSRPALYGDQLGLLLLVIAAIGFGAWVVVRIL
jgi:flagellar biogenesis protein FliO